MALGFQDCCNQYSFFNVVGIPSTVSEYEVYYIKTVEGANFCAKYREIPVLNYTPPSYILLEMTQQTDCAVCIETNPCPAEETIFINQFLAGSVVAGSDCNVQTLMQMVVECQSTNPTFDNQTDGVVRLFVSGGTPPYTFFSADTQEVLSTTEGNDIYTVFPNATEGSYNIVVVDDAGDFIIPITCVLDAPPNLPIIVPIMTPTSFYGAPDGRISFDITGGNPPYTILYEGEILTGTLQNLAAGTYIFQVLDTQTYQEVSVEVTQPDELNFPDALCMQFTLCGTNFKITLVKTNEFLSYRPIYRSTNSSQVGVISFDLKYVITQYTQGWTVQPVPVQTEDIRFTTPPGNCTNLSDSRFTVISFLNILPQGTYSSFFGILNGITVSIVPGGCPPSLTAEVLEGYCAGPPVSLGKVQLEAFGGAGPPYTFFYSAGNGGAYTQTTSSILELQNGTYAVKVKDGLGAESTPISVTVPTVSNLFPGNQVGFCSVIENLDSVLTGTLTPLNEGESRTFEAVINEYFDFSNLPDGAKIGGKFFTQFSAQYTGADDGYNQINDAVEFGFEIQEAYILQNGVRTDWTSSNFTFGGYNFLNGSPQPTSNAAGDQLGSTQLFADNYGWFIASNTSDACTASTVPDVYRTSPNGWYDCDMLYGETFGVQGSSLIEGDRRGKTYLNLLTLSSPYTEFTNQTRIYFRYRVKMKNKMPVYIPTILNETNSSTLQPQSYTILGESKLNQPNTEGITIGGDVGYSYRHAIINPVVLQRPTSPPCWGPQLSNGVWGGLGFIPSTINPNTTGSVRSYFNFNSNDSGVGILNFFKSTNNTCTSYPSWAP